MIFDLFHSISDPVIQGRNLGAPTVFRQFLAQVQLAEQLGMDTVWLAESHFSSEVQKKTSAATIPEFHGEVGLNSDSFQWFHWLQSQTKKINLGIGIHNIVGGSGGPIASADRVNTLRFLNEHFWPEPRQLRIGVASGRFAYQNEPFGAVARTSSEQDFWPLIRRTLFLEALEIFLRLLSGESLSANDLTKHYVESSAAEKYFGDKLDGLRRKYAFPFPIARRWNFESLQLVPRPEKNENLHIVLGSSDPEALALGNQFWDLDLFNLSFTPPEAINKLHQQMQSLCAAKGRLWRRSRLPRTVMVFIDPDPKKALARAHFVLDTYIEAMRGTAAVPDKQVLLERALIGDAQQVREQLSPENARGFAPEDRLMLWFEFNQMAGAEIEKQMTYFVEKVAAHF